jgi:hypothetical protein
MLARFPYGDGRFLTYLTCTSKGDYRTGHSCGGSPGSSSSYQGIAVNSQSLSRNSLAYTQRAACMEVSTRRAPCGNSSLGAPDSHSVTALRPQHPQLQLGPHTHWSPNQKYQAASLLPLQVGLPPIPKTFMPHHRGCHHLCPLRMNTPDSRLYPVLVVANSIDHARVRP